MMIYHKSRKTLKIVVICILSLLGIAIGVILWLSTHYKGIIQKNLPGWVASASDSLYKVSVDDISINLLANKVTLEGVRLWADSSRLQYLSASGQTPQTVFNMNIPGAVVKGIDFGALIGTKNLVCEKFYLQKPDVIITALPKDTLQADTAKDKPSIDKVGSDYLYIQQAHIVYQNHANTDSNTYVVKGGNITFTDWFFKPGAKNKNQKLYDKLDNIEIDSFGYTTYDGLYYLQCGHISMKDKQTTIKDFRFKPRYDKGDFYKKVGHEKEIYNIHFPFIQLSDFDAEALLNDNTIKASNIQLKQAYINIYYSRVPPDNTKSKVGNFPNQLVQKFGISTYVKHVDVTDGKFRYTEKNAYTMREGSFYIQDINGAINNITNIPGQLASDHHCIIKLHGNFMGRSSIRATFNLNLNDTLGGFTVTGEHRNLDAGEIREMVKALAVADLQNMHASSIKFTVRGNQNASDGDMTMLYNNLKIKLMKIEDDKDLKKQGLISFIAKATLIYESNPEEGEEVRSVTMHQVRRPTGSFFNLIWKTLFEGITETALKTEGAADYVQHAGPDNKKGIIKTIKQVFSDKDKKKEKDKEQDKK